MNREQAKELLPIIQAFAEGKTIQVKSSDGLWYGREGENYELNFNADPQVYRIKSEPKYRPFANAEECWHEMQKHEPFGWVKYKEGDKYTTYCNIDGNCDFELDFEEYTFADGTPFGIKGE